MPRKAATPKSTSNFANSLDTIPDYAERQRLTALSVLRQATGRVKSRQARIQGEEFDWNEFKVQFFNDYGALNLQELIALNRKHFGLGSMDAINERYRYYQQQLYFRHQRLSA
jgi:hypothetical protein